MDCQQRGIEGIMKVVRKRIARAWRVAIVLSLALVAGGVLQATCRAASAPDWLTLRVGQESIVAPGSAGQASVCDSEKEAEKPRNDCAKIQSWAPVIVLEWKTYLVARGLTSQIVRVRLKNGTRSGWVSLALLRPSVPKGTMLVVSGAACASQFSRAQDAQAASLDAIYEACKALVLDQVVKQDKMVLELRFSKSSERVDVGLEDLAFPADPDHFETWKPIEMLSP